MLIKIRVARQKIDFFAYKISWKSSLKQLTRILKNKKFKKITLSIMKNLRNKNYSDAMNLANKIVFNKDFEFDYIFNINIAMKEISDVINLNSWILKYKKIKQIKFNSIEIIKISKKFKKLTSIIKEQFNFVDVIKQILNTFIKIRFRKLFNISFELFKQMFRNITNKKIKTILKKQKIIASLKAIKKKNACWFDEI